jgi:acetoin utilization deacetylase AcuC-like enzyme
MTRRLFYTEHHVLPLPPGHRFPIEKYRLLRELLARDNHFTFEPAPLADIETIELAHDRDYINAFLHGTLSPAVIRRIGFPWSEALFTRTLASVGSTLAATREAQSTGWGGTLAGGTHHAFAAEGSGFCIFNDIAIAARSVQKNGVHRIAILDLDVHQGDGTAHIFRNDPSVLTISVHCKANFPLRKQQSSLDVELEAGTADAEYLNALATVLPKMSDFHPDFVFYQSGVDALATDRLGRLHLTPAGLEERDRMVMRAALDLAVPFVITIGGGYSDPIILTAQAHANTFRIAQQILG